MSRDLSKVFLLKEGDREGVGQFTKEKFPSTLQKLLNKRKQKQQAAISQKEIVFRFRKDLQSEKGWGLMSCA